MIPAEVHPGPSAGDGRLEPRRTTYKRGDREIELRKCAQCGFINRDGIETIGDSQDSPGVAQNLVTIAVNIKAANLPQPLKGMAAFQKTSVQYQFPYSTAGCRLCGSLNSVGANRNWRDYGTGVDFSNK